MNCIRVFVIDTTYATFISLFDSITHFMTFVNKRVNVLKMTFRKVF